jgi:hypothetical protein
MCHQRDKSRNYDIRGFLNRSGNEAREIAVKQFVVALRVI